VAEDVLVEVDRQVGVTDAPAHRRTAT
jgi:hypothetical protein